MAAAHSARGSSTRCALDEPKCQWGVHSASLVGWRPASTPCLARGDAVALFLKRAVLAVEGRETAHELVA